MSKKTATAGSQTLKTQYRISDFVAWQRNGELELNPNFQRRPVWKKGAKSYLIDTIIRGLPMPIIFLRDLPSDLTTLKSKRDVVDGQQRIRTIISYIDHTLLNDFDSDRDLFTINRIHNKELGGLSFKELSPTIRQSILDYQFSVHSFPADTDDREILQIFARMNATGMNLNDQELRNAEFYGHFKTVAYAIATEQLRRWQGWKIFTPQQIARMSEVELASEFMLLIMDGVLQKKGATINWYYKEYDEKFQDSGEVASRFRTVFDTIENEFGQNIITDFFSNKTIFYALFAVVYASQFGVRNNDIKKHKLLQKEKPKSLSKRAAQKIVAAAEKIKKGEVPPNVLKATRGATAHASQRRLVIGHLAGGEFAWLDPR